MRPSPCHHRFPRCWCLLRPHGSFRTIFLFLQETSLGLRRAWRWLPAGLHPTAPAAPQVGSIACPTLGGFSVPSWCVPSRRREPLLLLQATDKEMRFSALSWFALRLRRSAGRLGRTPNPAPSPDSASPASWDSVQFPAGGTTARADAGLLLLSRLDASDGLRLVLRRVPGPAHARDPAQQISLILRNGSPAPQQAVASLWRLCTPLGALGSSLVPGTTVQP